MTGINLTNKEINLLVNGNQQEKFIQRANSADYDVSVSGGANVALDTGFNPSLTYNNIAFGIVSLASDADSGGSPGFHRYEASFSDGSSFSTETDSGNPVVFTRAGAYPTGANVENQGGTDDVVSSGTQAHTITYQGDISVNGFSQSTSPDIDFETKAVDVLVNDNLEGNFTQTAPSADYDVSVDAIANDITVFEDQKTTDSNDGDMVGTYTLGEEVSQADDIEVFVSTDGAGTFDIDVLLDGTTVINSLESGPYQQTTTLSNPSSGDTLDYTLGSNANNATITFKVIAKQNGVISTTSVTKS